MDSNLPWGVTPQPSEFNPSKFPRRPSPKVTPLVIQSTGISTTSKNRLREELDRIQRFQRDSGDFETSIIVRDLDREPHGSSPEFVEYTELRADEFDLRLQLPTPCSASSSPLFQSHARYASDSRVSYLQDIETKHIEPRRVSMMPVLPSPTAPNINLPLEISQRKYSVPASDDSYETNKSQKSPGGNRFTSFFRWQSTSSHDSATTVSARASSPPRSPKTLGPSFRSVPPMIDTLRANAANDNAYLSDSALSIPPTTPGLGSFDSIEEELRLVSAELAASIKREMELEDLVEKLEAEAADANNNREKRTSDYFSDVGTPDRGQYGSITKHEQELERLKRQCEQERAQIRLELLGKLSEERQRRVDVETQARELEDHVSRGEYSQLVSTDAGKVRVLEQALEDAKRKLAEEKLARENFEQLVTAIKMELEEHREERDRLRDEVVPNLRQRVVSLEAETAQMQQVMADKTRIQQEFAALKTENIALMSSQRKPMDIRMITSVDKRMSLAITPAEKRMSIAQMQGLAVTTSTGSLSPIVIPLSPKEKETLADRLKDVEQQRDELQKALRALRERQKVENRQAAQRIKALELERDRALRDSPRKFGNSREVQLLRREVDRLRTRAEDALEAKFKCERNLGSLKMDLERAEQETAVLRALLQEHDSLVNQHEELKDSHIRLSKKVSEMESENSEATSASLQRAYRDLLLTHELTLGRLGELEVKECDLSEDFEARQRKLVVAYEESEKAMKKLRQSLAEAEAERHLAQTEAVAYKKQASALSQAEKSHLGEERTLASQLKESTERVQQLAAQVQAQMQSNGALRDRLAAAINRGESEQQNSANRINELQGRLKQLEEKVLSAQQETEDAIHNHEEEIQLLQLNHSAQLTRLKATLIQPPEPRSPKMPLTPLLKSPRLEWVGKVGASSNDNLGNSSERLEFLEKKVVELERALADADREMEEVVNKMSMAQIEVMELTSQRDEAARQTRKLQADIALEKAKYAQLALA
ncbi:hypothetical protein BGX38DRAFT_1273200 [Terfezia claveryi]|nr:hypothetical protein BGX38DRAFT_1273200 [Terfezia claveryi]